MFILNMKPHEEKTYYLKVENRTTALRLGLCLEDKDAFITSDRNQQLIVSLFFSVVVMLLLYNTLIFIYTLENTYLFYSLYLLTILMQQATYLGMSQIFLPKWLIYYDNLSVVLKVNLMYIAAAIFAKSFLQTTRYPSVNKIYNSIITIAIIEIPLFGTMHFYYPEIAILTGFVFVLFNFFTGIYIYNQGYHQARLFIVGWSFLVIGFTLMILDGLGIISVMHKMQDLIMALTALEALALSLAFTDRYIILKRDKEKSDAQLLKTLQERQSVIEREIEKKTKTLNDTLENKKILLKELQHRTKNNLQLILSLVRMQSDNGNHYVKEQAQDLEYRINAIAKTHQILYLKDDLEHIDMDVYIEELCEDVEKLSEEEIDFRVNANAIQMPLKEAGYLGLILNELMTNAIKYVTHVKLKFEVNMYKKSDKYILQVTDNGFCYDETEVDKKSIGLKLVRTLVQDQLEGQIRLIKKSGCSYRIEFIL
jgi:two-component sensor histidine kinase